MNNKPRYVFDTNIIQVFRNMKDNIFLELVVSGNASQIITGDGDLLSLNPFRGISILSPQKFLESLG